MNLRTNYMGLHLRSPIVASASPLSREVDNIKRMEDAGAGAVVLFSLFEEQLRGEAGTAVTDPSSIIAPKIEYFPSPEEYQVDKDQYLELIHTAKQQIEIPLIASLNGMTNEGWVDYAREMEKAGADGIELNVYFIPTDLDLSGQAVENRYLDILKSVKNAVSLPVAVKLNPYFSSMGYMAKQLRAAGADALVLFNRFYQPDLDIAQLRVSSNLQLSQANEIRLPLLWIALLYGRLKVSLAATTGVQGAHEVIKYLLAGADVVMTASALYKYGIDYIATMTGELKEWMKSLHFDSIQEFKGILSRRNIYDPTAYERANYIRILEQYK